MVGVVFGRLGLRLEVVNGAGQKAARTAGGVQHHFAQARVEDVHHEPGDGAGRVVLARIARRLQVGQNLLVDVVEQVAVLEELKSMSASMVLTTCRSSVPDFM